MSDLLIYQTDHFVVEAVNQPLVTRTDGGHIKISPKIRVKDRQSLTPSQQIEMAWLESLIGEAMTLGLQKQGIDIGIINYQDNKNWGVFKPEGPYMHIHLYGRAKSAKFNPYGEAIFAGQRSTGFYDNFEPLSPEDISAIKAEIKILLNQPRYQKQHWCWQ